MDSVAAYYWGYDLIQNLGNPYKAAEVHYASGYRQGYKLRVLNTLVTNSRERPSRVYRGLGLRGLHGLAHYPTVSTNGMQLKKSGL